MNYPEDFYTFSGEFYDVPDHEIQQWVDRCIAHIEEDSAHQVARFSCGNCIVIAIRWPGSSDIEVNVAKNYQQHTLYTLYKEDAP